MELGLFVLFVVAALVFWFGGVSPAKSDKILGRYVDKYGCDIMHAEEPEAVFWIVQKGCEVVDHPDPSLPDFKAIKIGKGKMLTVFGAHAEDALEKRRKFSDL